MVCPFLEYLVDYKKSVGRKYNNEHTANIKNICANVPAPLFSHRGFSKRRMVQDAVFFGTQGVRWYVVCRKNGKQNPQAPSMGTWGLVI